MDGIGERTARLLKAVSRRLIRIWERMHPVGAEAMRKAGHVLMVGPVIKVLDQRQVQRVDAPSEDLHAAVRQIGIICPRSTQANSNLAVRKSGLLIKERIDKFLCLIDELLYIILKVIERTALRYIIRTECDQKIVDAFVAVILSVLLEIEPFIIRIPEGIAFA